MRVQNPDKYAEVLLGVSQPEERYTAERISRCTAAANAPSSFKNPIPVHITYQTAFVDDAGQRRPAPTFTATTRKSPGS